MPIIFCGSIEYYPGIKLNIGVNENIGWECLFFVTASGVYEIF